MPLFSRPISAPRYASIATAGFMLFGGAGLALAQDDQRSNAWVQTTPAGVAPETSDPRGFWHRTGAGLEAIWSGDQLDVYVPGYIWHLPWRYPTDRRSSYNDIAWGAGMGRTLVDERGRLRSLFGIVSADSYAKPQYMAGYAWRARTRPRGPGLRLGGGYTLLVIGRSDKLRYTPLPIMLPLGSIGTDRIEIVGAYVPGFEVGYFFARLRMK
jgi:lipid IVA palmitoyltransferase